VDVKWIDIRPEHLGIQPRLEDGLIRFTLQEPRNLSIEINRNLEAIVLARSALLPPRGYYLPLVGSPSVRAKDSRSRSGRHSCGRGNEQMAGRFCPI
jgi:hypothetical protein